MIFSAGWNLPENYDREEFARIKQAAEKIRRTADVLIVIGIGGSYLGARAAIEFVKGQMYNQVRPEGTPEVYFAGNNISSSYLNDLVKIIGDRDFCINVISKSGTTTEPAIAFRIFKELCEKKYGREGAKERIFATTDKERGALKQLADDEGYETFVVPDDIGGRFLCADAGRSAADGGGGRGHRRGRWRARPQARIENLADTTDHARAQYAALRSILHRKGKVDGDLGQLRAGARHARRMVQAAVRRVRGQGPQGALRHDARTSRPTCIPSVSSFRTARA